MASSAVLTNPSVERVRAALERAGMPAEIVELPGAARTARAAADFLGCVDVAKADAEFVRRHTGFAIGGVAPVGHGLAKVFAAGREAELAA